LADSERTLHGGGKPERWGGLKIFSKKKEGKY